jgi:hypothetical protein
MSLSCHHRWPLRQHEPAYDRDGVVSQVYPVKSETCPLTPERQIG